MVDAQTYGIDFRNDIDQTAEMNYFTNQYVLNGGGVAAGDLNNDGLPDLYFTANQNANKLYLNRGEMKFEDVSSITGTAGNAYWTTGVAIVDVNADGWNDIYVCHAGTYLNEPEKLRNELFINNGEAGLKKGIPTFTESALEYGLAGFSRSVQSYFFDYDNDGDLDVYLVNHPYNFWLPIDMRVEAESDPYPDETDQLFRNNGNGTFTDLTQEAGLKNWAFGLSASIGDLDQDGWMDIYVCNDYSEKDELYMNNGDGTFRKSVDSAMFHISNFSMGSDIADFNNDLLPDLISVDMMAEDNRRKKINMSAMKPEVFWDNVALGRHYQYMQNALQLNNGNGTFSEVAELAGVAFTDWSWSPLFADLDNDGWKDLFVSNGLALDVRNTDANKKLLGQDLKELRKGFKKHLSKMPSEPIKNYAYRNNGNLSFQKKTHEWGLDFLGFSTGAVCADLDRDGDLDVVVNNVNDTARLFVNNSTAANYIQFQASGPELNRRGIGLTVTIFSCGNAQTQHMASSRGFQSGADALLHFGVGESELIDSAMILWPGGREEWLKELKTGQLVSVKYADATEAKRAVRTPQTVFGSYSTIDFTHEEDLYDDYAEEVLLPHKYSQLGPFSAKGDVNKDGLEDLIIGGASGQAAKLLLQDMSGNFRQADSQPWSQHSAMEDMGMLMFDADADNDLDIYICSGSNEWAEGYGNYLDRIYLNDGKGNFSYSASALPSNYTSSSCVTANDFDNDGDLDLFVGGTLIPRKYPMPASSRILQNDNGKFTDVTAKLAPEFAQLGMVTAAIWANVDQTPEKELVVCGEWMPVSVFQFADGKFANITKKAGLAENTGWWYSLQVADLDNDGDNDIIAGNLGLNTKYKGTQEKPFHVYYHDFDSNGKGDIVLSYEQDDAIFTVRGRSCSSQQIPSLQEKFPTYELFGSATVKDAFGSAVDSALHYQARNMATSVLWNNGDGTFDVKPLPNQAQLSSTNGIEVLDFNADGLFDIVLVGNNYQAETETCRHDASVGLVLLGQTDRSFMPLSVKESGFSVVGDSRSIQKVFGQDGNLQFLITRNNDSPILYRLSPNLATELR